MIKFDFDIEDQKNRYEKTRRDLRKGFYQRYKFYVLPFMPPKFRNRMVYLPEICNPILEIRSKMAKIERLKKEWEAQEDYILKKVFGFFPEARNLNITISPSLYGNLGTYRLFNGRILLMPRYDRSVGAITMLLVNTLAHYFLFKRATIKSGSKTWIKKQEKTIEIYRELFGKNPKPKGLTKILDSEYAGKLAEKSAEYLHKLGNSSQTNLPNLSSLTKNENVLLNLLLENKNKLVSFDQIADAIWPDNPDKFSEYAITKLAERLKKKLPKNSIHPQRGTGYILYI